MIETHPWDWPPCHVDLVEKDRAQYKCVLPGFSYEAKSVRKLQRVMHLITYRCRWSITKLFNFVHRQRVRNDALNPVFLRFRGNPLEVSQSFHYFYFAVCGRGEF